MPPARWFFSRLSTILVAAVAFVAGGAQAQVTTAGNTFTITGIDVDVMGPDAIKAREQGIREAQGKAVKLLIERMVAPEDRSKVPPLGAGQLDTMVRGVEFANERTASNRYIATLSIVFAADPVKAWLAQGGISVVETAVGDRYVLQAMVEGGFTLGGEQSGHVVMGDIATTGDGLLTAIHVLGHMAQTGRSLADLASVVEPLPQVLLNVSGVDRAGLADNTAIAEEVAAVLSELEGRGRVLLRPSGTEPVVRVMVEAPTTEQANAMAQRLADRVRTELAP